MYYSHQNSQANKLLHFYFICWSPMIDSRTPYNLISLNELLSKVICLNYDVTENIIDEQVKKVIGGKVCCVHMDLVISCKWYLTGVFIVSYKKDKFFLILSSWMILFIRALLILIADGISTVEQSFIVFLIQSQ